MIEIQRRVESVQGISRTRFQRECWNAIKRRNLNFDLTPIFEGLLKIDLNGDSLLAISNISLPIRGENKQNIPHSSSSRPLDDMTFSKALQEDSINLYSLA